MSPPSTPAVPPTAAPATLPSASQQLVRLMRFVGFGRIENLAVRNGLPSFDAAPLVIRTIRVGGTGGNRPPRPHRREVEMLKCATAELLEHLRRLGDGTVRRIEVAHGKPLFFEVEERPASAANGSETGRRPEGV